MPLTPGSSSQVVSKNISELHTGKTYAHTTAKFGKDRANKQSIAIALSEARHNRTMGGPVAGMDLPPTGMPGMQAPATGVMPTMGQALGSPPMGLAGPGAMQAPLPQNNVSMAPPSPMAGSPMGVAGPQPPQMPVMPGQTPQNMPSMNQGGSVPGLATGGFNMAKSPHMTPGFAEKGLQRNLNRSLVSPMTKGPILSAVPGRTDAHKTHVPSGSYVIPADIVSGRGQGNTLAGAHALQKLFKMGPYGAGSPQLKRGPGAPHAPIVKMRADGGETDDNTGTPVRVNLAGGEIVVPPENLMDVVHPDLKSAHGIMDAWVLHERKLLRKTLAKLPGPVVE